MDEVRASWIRGDIQRYEREVATCGEKCSDYLKKERELNEKLSRLRKELLSKGLNDSWRASKERDIERYERDLLKLQREHESWEQRRDRAVKSLEEKRKEMDALLKADEQERQRKEEEWKKKENEQRRKEEEWKKKENAQKEKYEAELRKAKQESMSHQRQFSDQQITAIKVQSSQTHPKKKHSILKAILLVWLGLLVLSSLSNRESDRKSESETSLPQSETSLVKTAPVEQSTISDISPNNNNTWDVDVIPSSFFDKYYTCYTTEVLNLRKGPGTNYTRITSVERGGQVLVAAKQGDWMFVKVGGHFGWMNSAYLSTLKPSDTNTTPAKESTGGNLRQN